MPFRLYDQLFTLTSCNFVWMLTAVYVQERYICVRTWWLLPPVLVWNQEHSLQVLQKLIIVALVIKNLRHSLSLWCVQDKNCLPSPTTSWYGIFMHSFHFNHCSGVLWGGKNNVHPSLRLGFWCVWVCSVRSLLQLHHNTWK